MQKLLPGLFEITIIMLLIGVIHFHQWNDVLLSQFPILHLIYWLLNYVIHTHSRCYNRGFIYWVISWITLVNIISQVTPVTQQNLCDHYSKYLYKKIFCPVTVKNSPRKKESLCSIREFLFNISLNELKFIPVMNWIELNL